MPEKLLSLPNNLQVLGRDSLYSIVSEGTTRKVVLFDAETLQRRGFFDLPEATLVSGFKAISRGGGAVVVTGPSFALVLDASLQKVLWKLDSSRKDHAPLLKQSFVFQGVGPVRAGLVFGTLTSELFLLKGFGEQRPSEAEKGTPGLRFGAVHQFRFKNVSVTDVVSGLETEKAESGEAGQGDADSVAVALSNSKIVKVRLPVGAGKAEATHSFQFADNFCSALLLRLARLRGQSVLLSANVNGTLSLLRFADLAPLLNFSLFSKSVTSLSASRGEGGNWAVRLGSNDGFGGLTSGRAHSG